MNNAEKVNIEEGKPYTAEMMFPWCLVVNVDGGVVLVPMVVGLAISNDQLTGLNHDEKRQFFMDVLYDALDHIAMVGLRTPDMYDYLDLPLTNKQGES